MPDSPIKLFKIDPGEAGRRLDLFLAGRFSKLSRSQIQRMIEKGFVKVDGEFSKPGHRLRARESIRIEFLPAKKSDVVAEPIPLDILYEDAALIVLNKSAERIVHPAAGIQEGTLVNALLHHCRDFSGIGGVERPGIVHRLDKGTSGVMVVAKDDQTHRHLAKQFHSRSVEKTYLAFIWGLPRDAEGIIDLPLGRSEGDRKKFSTKSCHLRSALTRYRVLKNWGPISLLELKPQTGRTHQLRVHLSAIGHPVVGDPTYGKGLRRLSALPEELRAWLAERPFQFLHALTLAFTHPRTGRLVTFSAPLRPEMLELQKRLGELGEGAWDKRGSK
jgi:23S rRNA pseudouridine1911/1915/1917 synthase